jgi:hypothetical protein
MAANFLGDGYTPRKTDPKRIRWVKILMKFQDQGGTSTTNDPLPGDPLRVIKQKVLCSIKGQEYTG